MIIKFNEEVFNSKNPSVLKDLTRLILDFLDDRFLWDLDNLIYLFLDDERETQIIEETNHWQGLGDLLKNEIYEHICVKIEQAAYITDQKKFYLSSIIIGEGNGEITPNEALKILTEKSLVVVENNLNDWNFVFGILKNYANYSNKKNIYKIIKKAVEDNYLQPRGFGGAGEIKKNLESLITTSYKNIFKFKLSTLFDSDLKKAEGIISNTVFYLLLFLKGRKFDRTDKKEHIHSSNDLIQWHMLYKREIENYVPLDLMLSTFPDIPAEKQAILNNMDKDQLDFYNFGECQEITKNGASKIFLTDSIREKLSHRVEHHKLKSETPNNILEDVDELEKILIMLAKIV